MNVRHGFIWFGALVTMALALFGMQGCFMAVDYLGSDCPVGTPDVCCPCNERGECVEEDALPPSCLDGGTEGGQRQ